MFSWCKREYGSSSKGWNHYFVSLYPNWNFPKYEFLSWKKKKKTCVEESGKKCYFIQFPQKFYHHIIPCKWNWNGKLDELYIYWMNSWRNVQWAPSWFLKNVFWVSNTYCPHRARKSRLRFEHYCSLVSLLSLLLIHGVLQ